MQKAAISQKSTSQVYYSRVRYSLLLNSRRLEPDTDTSCRSPTWCIGLIARTDSQEHVKMEVWHAPGRSKPTFDEAKRKHYKALRKGERFGPSWTNHWVRSTEPSLSTLPSINALYVKGPHTLERAERLARRGEGTTRIRSWVSIPHIWTAWKLM